MSSNPSSLNWCFTVNNYVASDLNKLRNLVPSYLSYCVVGREVASTGTPHLQGYFELTSRRLRSAILKKLSLSSCHLEPRRGTQADAIRYCMKDGDYDEFGLRASAPPVPASKGKNKLLPFLPILKSGGLSELSAHPECTLHLLKHAEKHLEINMSPRKRSDPLTVIWLHGSTGTGKTRSVYDYCERHSLALYSRTGASRFFNGFDGERHVLFDDFRDSHFEFSNLLVLLDVYPQVVDVKGSFRQWRPNVVFITCPYPPTEAYKGIQSSSSGYDKHQQLMRRLTYVVEVSSYNEFLIEKILTPPSTPPRSLFPIFRPLESPPLPQTSTLLRSPLPPLVRSGARFLASPTQIWDLVEESP